MSQTFEEIIAQYLEENPDQAPKPEVKPIPENEMSLVDSIINVGEDPEFPNEPEDQFGLPKQLNTIAGLRKKGFDNSRIFKAMELETAEEASTQTSKPDIEGEGKNFIGPVPQKRGGFAKANEQRKRTAKSTNLDVLFYESFFNFPGSGSFEDAVALRQEYEEMVQEDSIVAEDWLEYVGVASGGLIGTMGEGMKAGLPYAAAGMTGAAMLGQMGPQAAIPEELVTVPLSGSLGMAVGSTIFWSKQGAGMMMRNMMERGVSPGKAALLGNVGGIFYGLIEQLQVSKLIPKTMQQKANKIVTKKITESIGKWGKEYGEDWLTQIGQEELQLVTEMLTTELGATFEGVETRTWESMVAEAWETAKQTGAGLIPMKGVQGGIDYAVSNNDKISNVVSGIMATTQELESSDIGTSVEDQIKTSEERLTVQSTAKQISDDPANDFNIVIDEEGESSRLISEEELLATAYNIDLNKIPVAKEDEYGNKFYAVKIKGENDSEGNIKLTSGADRSTILEETVEARLKGLQKSKNEEDIALVAKIEKWFGSVRKKASEMGLELRFDEGDIGNIELFSDAIVYTLGGFSGLSKEFQDAIYIPEDISSEFIEKLGKMSDGTNVFELLKGSEKGIVANKEFAQAVDEDILSQTDLDQENVRPPPSKPPIKSILQKKKKKSVVQEKAEVTTEEPNNGSIKKYTTFSVDGGKIVIGEQADETTRPFIDEIKVDESKRRRGIGSSLLQQAIDMFGSLVGQASNDAAVDMNYKLGMRAYDKSGKELTLAKTKKKRKEDSSVMMVANKEGDSSYQLEPAFKKWFSNSKIVDKQGNPLVVYHGTTEKVDFKSFNKFSFFSTMSSDAERYTETDLYGKDAKPRIIPVYLSIKKPLDLISIGDITKDFQLKSFLDKLSKINKNFSNIKLNDMYEGEPTYYALFDFDNYPNKEYDTIHEYAEKLGYDGIKLIENGIINYQVFEPTQVKSVFNQGTFDENNANISYQLEPAVIEKAVGLYPDVMSTKEKAERLRLTLERRDKTPNVGRQKNNRVEFELKNGGVMILGRDKTPEDWIRQVESVLDEGEVTKAMNWYEDAYPAFVDEFGETDAVNYMVAWLLGNVQASPQQALSNTFLGAEQLSAELPSFKSPGTGMVAKNIKDTLQGIQAEKGAGAKLYDFLDSALGKETRTIMQDDPLGLMAVAIDRHTYRDAGFIDGAIRNILMRLAKDTERVKRLRYDSRGSSPSDTQYEYAVQYMNDLTDKLNAMGYMGGNLKPHQVQAIGWTAIARMAESSEGQSIPDAIGLQKPTIAFEVEFGKGSPLETKYGKSFFSLEKKEQLNLTDKIVKEVVPELAKEMGLKIGSISSKGYGFWGEIDDKKGPAANASMEVRGSSQGIKGFMNALGILFQQDEIGLLSKGTNLKGLGLGFEHKDLSNPEMQEAVYTILREETRNEITPGATNQIVDGMPTLTVGTFINQDQLGDYADEIASAVERIRTELGLELNLRYGGAKYENTKNDWTKDSKGGQYRNKALQTHKRVLLERLDNYYGKKVQSLLESEFGKQQDQQRKSRQLVPDFDYAAEVQAAEDNRDLELSDQNKSAWIRKRLFDKLDPILRWQKDVQDQFLNGNRVRQHHDVALASEMYIGKVSEKLKDFNKILIGDNPDSFVSRLRNEVGINLEDFAKYLHALHATERNDKMGEDGLSGMSKQAAREFKAEMNSEYGLKNLNKFVKEFRRDVVDAGLKLRLETGLISQEDYDNLTSAYKNYVPLYRVRDNDENVIEESKKGPMQFNIKGKEFRKARGSKREVKNPFVSALEQYHEAVIRSEKNLVNKRLLALVESYPSDAYEVKGVPHKPIYDQDGEVEYYVPIEGKDSNGDPLTDSNVVNVKVDGKTQQIIFKGENGHRIARAMLDMGRTKGIRALYQFNNYLRYVNTIANPEFMVTNFVRDIQTAGINISAEQGNQVMIQALSPKNLKNAWKSVYNVVQNDDTSSEWGQLYEKLRKAGGKTGFFDYERIEDKVQALEKDLKRVEKSGRGIKKAGKSIFNFVENVNEATESAVRLTLFKAMLDHGYSTEEAASGAKNVTINFNRKGEMGQVLNSLYLFANAGLQGSHRIYGVVKNSKKAQGAVATLAALGATEAILNNMADDDDEYDKLGNWEKDNNFIIRYGKGDKFFKLRLPYGYNMFKVAGNIAGDIAWRQMNGEALEMGKQMARFLEAFNSAFNPIGGGDFIQTLSPTSTDWMVQLSQNKAFHGGPLKPEQVYGPKKAEIENAWERTPGVYKDMTQWWFEATGGNIRYNGDGSIKHAVRGPMGRFGDVSPEFVEFWVDYLGGGLGKSVMRTVNTAKGIVNHDADWTKAPFLRQFYGKFDTKSEARILYEFEKDMGRTIYTEKEAIKYYNYLEDYYYKGNITQKERQLRYRRFVKAQNKAILAKQ